MPQEMVERRERYRTDKPFSELVKPHFYALTPEGELTPVSAEPDLIVEHGERLRVRLAGENGFLYLDLLALESELVGEHPIHKVYRLAEMGIPLGQGVRDRLDSQTAGDLFATVEFEFQRRQYSSGVVAEVFLDGTLLVIPFEIPPIWQSADDRIASPTHLHLTPLAFSGGSSLLARQFEFEMLSLPFEDQRYPPAALARQQCEVYRQSLAANDYRNVLQSVGFRYTPSHVTDTLDEGVSFSSRIESLMGDGAGEGVRYYGYNSSWIADVLRSEGVTWLGDCDTAGGLRPYPAVADGSPSSYLTVRRSLEPDKTQRYRLMEVDEFGAATELYVAPGIMLMALPLPYNHRLWLLSAEGWNPAQGDLPADPRWQAVYLVDLDNPGEFVKVRYPIDRFPRAPEAGLYGASPRISSRGEFLFNTLYGFRDEGGGIWAVDLSSPDFHADPANFARIVSWDHTLSWLPLDGPERDSPTLHLFMTGKEVADDFAMTANVIRIREDGLNSSVERSERLLQMVGWNPVPFGWQRLSGAEYRMLVETHYNYESSLMPRAKGVYIVPVNLAEE